MCSWVLRTFILGYNLHFGQYSNSLEQVTLNPGSVLAICFPRLSNTASLSGAGILALVIGYGDTLTCPI